MVGVVGCVGLLCQQFWRCLVGCSKRDLSNLVNCFGPFLLGCFVVWAALAYLAFAVFAGCTGKLSFHSFVPHFFCCITKAACSLWLTVNPTGHRMILCRVWFFVRLRLLPMGRLRNPLFFCLLAFVAVFSVWAASFFCAVKWLPACFADKNSFAVGKPACSCG